MTKDGWLGPDTCGVKLTEFEHMTRQMTAAAPGLRRLADELWQALHGAGVSTAPAMEIKRIADWADGAASDLRRRTVLVHDLDRQGLAFTVCRPDGTYLKLPDRYTDQVAYADGRRKADTFRRAAHGDASAQAALRRLRPDDLTPMFAKGLLESLGPEELLKLPMALSLGLAGDLNRHRPGTDARAADTRAVLALLGRSLALATDPHGKAYLGDDYLTGLREAGRTTFPPRATLPNGTAGYQSLATLIGSSDTRFSTRFIDVVGNDMVAFDSGIRKNLGEAPLPDLAGRYNLGNALDPSKAKGDGKTDFLSPLLEAAGASGREAAQALLNHHPDAPLATGPQPTIRLTNLEYLLHDRRATWGQTDHGAALGTTIEAAATGHDPESSRLAFAIGKILADDARANVEVKDGKLKIGDKSPLAALAGGSLSDALARPRHYDELSGLRPAMAAVLVAHLDRLHDIVRLSAYDERPGSTGLTGEDLDHLLLDVTRDAGAYEKLLMGQLAHTKLAVNGTVARHGDLSNTIAGEGRMFGHLLEARHQSVGAEEARLAEDLERMRKYVGYGLGLLPLGTDLVASRSPAAGKAYADASTKTTTLMTDWLAKRLADGSEPTILAPTTETGGIERLFNQLIVSSLVSHGRIESQDLRGRSFATKDHPPRIRPAESLDGAALESFLNWANEKLKVDSLTERAQLALENGQKVAAGNFKGPDGKSVAPSVQR
ncbi:hypothetical protein AGRA3207_003041 [Actinomadura graeca]|uniref:Uncharacterized protein n=1 Tax=Actinomadura graeca TaxID=2750812 RepID=A0ABX8QTN7_9ACTN|nr:hypothetical protein [Actinomadura graeca]QXJ22095.1 hypothetical protein AGRA3207_003041 [Actinomadura graeca]